MSNDKNKKRLFAGARGASVERQSVVVRYTDRVASPVGRQYHHVPYDTDPVVNGKYPVEVTARARI